MAKKITELTELASGVVSNDIIPIVDVSESVTKKITIINLLANGWLSADSMTYSSADDPTYTMTCSGDKTSVYYVGQKIKLTQSTGGTKYFIITKVEYGSPNTTITMYGGTDYNLENETISNPYYSIAKAPVGFPLDPTKWMKELKDTNINTQNNPVDGTYYNLGSLSLSIPIGLWYVEFINIMQAGDASNQVLTIRACLSTTNNSASDADLIDEFYLHSNISDGIYWKLQAHKYLSLTAKITYYLNARSNTGSLDYLQNRGDITPNYIRAVCTYL